MTDTITQNEVLPSSEAVETLTEVKEKPIEIIDDLERFTVPENHILLQVDYRRGYLRLYDYDLRMERGVFRTHESPLSGLYFDKNMSPVLLGRQDKVYKIEDYKYPVVYRSMITENYLQYADVDTHARTLVVNKDVLLQTEGKTLEIIAKTSGIRDQDITYAQSEIPLGLEKLKKHLGEIRKVVSSYHKEDDYEIIVNYIPDYFREGSFYAYPTYKLSILYHDITITNSVEKSHFIGDIVASMEFSYSSLENYFKLSGHYLHGTRITFTPLDLFFNYQHSHLGTTGMPGHNLCKFCIGESDHMFSSIRGDSYINEVELEGILMATEEYMSWESLEGGPHRKMESLGVFGMPIKIPERLDDIIVSLAYVKKIRGVIEKKLPLFKHLFYIENVEGKVRFNANKLAFLQKIVEILTDEELKVLFHKLSITRGLLNSERGYFYYNSELNTFSHSTKVSDWKSILEESRVKISNMQHVYINGKYIFPRLIEEDKEPEELSSGTRCLSPYAVLQILADFLYQLNLTLENEYRNK